MNVRVDFKWFMGWLTSQLVKVASIDGLPALANEGTPVVPRSSPEFGTSFRPKTGHYAKSETVPPMFSLAHNRTGTR